MGMGGSSGGGGSAGEVGWPTYMETYHRELLNVVDAAADMATTFAGPNAVTNPNFDGIAEGYPVDDYGWAYDEADWTVTSAYGPGELYKNQDGVTELTQSPPFLPLETGRTYVLSFYVPNMAVVGFTPYLGDTAGTAITAAGAYSEEITHAGPLVLRFVPLNLSRFYITNVSLNVVGSSPYEGENAYDPTAELDENTARYDELEALITALDPTMDWEGHVDRAVTKVDATFGDSHIDAIVDEYELEQETTLNRSINRFVGGMVEANAVSSSAFVMGMALLEGAHDRGVGGFRSTLKLQHEGRRAAQIDAATLRMFQHTQFEVGVTSQSLQQLIDKNRQSVIFRSEELKDDLAIGVKDATYNLDVLAYAANTLAAPGGGISPTASSNERGRSTSLLGGVMGGVSGAAMAGSMLDVGGSGLGISAAGGALSATGVGMLIGGAVLGLGASGIFD